MLKYLHEYLLTLFKSFENKIELLRKTIEAKQNEVTLMEVRIKNIKNFFCGKTHTTREKSYFK